MSEQRPIPSNSHPAARAAGFTALELSIAVALATFILVGAWQLFLETSHAVGESMRQVTVNDAASNSIQRMVDELKDSGEDLDGTPHVTSHPPGQTIILPFVTFQRRIAFNGDANDWEAPITYRLDPMPGETMDDVDNDGDGFVDEQKLVRVTSTESIDVAHNVVELRFTRLPGEHVLRIKITALGKSEDHSVFAISRDAIVGLRNVAGN